MKLAISNGLLGCLLMIACICGCSPEKGAITEVPTEGDCERNPPLCKPSTSPWERCHSKRREFAAIKDKKERIRRVKEFSDATLSMPLDRSTPERHSRSLDSFIYTAEAAFGANFDLGVNDPAAWDFLLESISRCHEEVRLAEKNCSAIETCTPEDSISVIRARETILSMQSQCERVLYKHIDFTARDNLPENEKKNFAESCKRIIGRYPKWYKIEECGAK